MCVYLSPPQTGWGHCRVYRDRSPGAAAPSAGCLAAEHKRSVTSCPGDSLLLTLVLKGVGVYPVCLCGWFSPACVYLSVVGDVGVHGAAGPLPVRRQQHQQLPVVSVFVRKRRRTDCTNKTVSETSQSSRITMSMFLRLMVEGAEFSKWEGAEWVELRLEEEGLVCRTNITFTSKQKFEIEILSAVPQGSSLTSDLWIFSTVTSFLTTSYMSPPCSSMLHTLHCPSSGRVPTVCLCGSTRSFFEVDVSSSGGLLPLSVQFPVFSNVRWFL